MALVSLITNQEAAEKIKPVFEGFEKKLGVVPNVFRAMAHNPEMLEAFLALKRHRCREPSWKASCASWLTSRLPSSTRAITACTIIARWGRRPG